MIDTRDVNTTRIGLVGCGQWGRLILRDLCTLGCRVFVVARSTESIARARQHGAKAIFATVSEVPDVDGLVVATPATTHAAVIMQLVERQVPIFVEKPLATSVDDARHLVDEAGERLFVMHKWRYHRGVEMLRDLARRGDLGPVRGVKTVRTGWHDSRDVDVTWHLCPHDLSITLEILGHIPAPRAATAQRVHGVAMAITAILGGRPWAVMECSGRDPAGQRRVILYCRDGMAVLSDSYADHVSVTRYGKTYTPETPPSEAIPIAADMPLLSELRAFVDHLNGGPPPRSAARDALTVVSTIDELRRLANI